jgi:hypothetical protein
MFDGVPDGRLRLVRDELDAVHIAERGALHEPGDAAHLDDVRLHHAHAGGDEICNTLERIRLLAGRDGDVEGLRHLAHGAHVIVLYRLLEPEEAELLERTPDADRAAHQVAVVGVEGAGRVDAARTQRTITLEYHGNRVYSKLPFPVGRPVERLCRYHVRRGAGDRAPMRLRATVGRRF